jgi:hypothetical protein
MSRLSRDLFAQDSSARAADKVATKVIRPEHIRSVRIRTAGITAGQSALWATLPSIRESKDCIARRLEGNVHGLFMQ